jgi:hypothetical protein
MPHRYYQCHHLSLPLDTAFVAQSRKCISKKQNSNGDYKVSITNNANMSDVVEEVEAGY